ncbi:MAG: PilZ domain-containing protein [Nitrospirota bacterium]|jgi:hypothetical protein
MAPSDRTVAVTRERRRHYRLSSDFDTAMRVGLVLAHGTEHPGEVVNLSASGISVRWPAERMVVVDVGQDVEFNLQPCSFDGAITVHAAVRWRDADDSGKIRYGFEFQDGAGCPDDVGASLSRLFDRRHGPR